jgi:hypothetical protein
MYRFNIADSGQMIHVAFNDTPNSPKSTVSRVRSRRKLCHQSKVLQVAKVQFDCYSGIPASTSHRRTLCCSYDGRFTSIISEEVRRRRWRLISLGRKPVVSLDYLYCTSLKGWSGLLADALWLIFVLGAKGVEYPQRFFARDFAGNRLEFSL